LQPFILHFVILVYYKIIYIIKQQNLYFESIEFVMENKNTEGALKWIVGILNEHKIPFQIIGGFAAGIYGSSRPLNDIDIAIPENKIKQVVADVKDYIIRRPERYIDENFDLILMTLRFEGQEIDICGDVAKMRGSKESEWKTNKIDFSKSEIKNIFGLDVFVSSKDGS